MFENNATKQPSYFTIKKEEDLRKIFEQNKVDLNQKISLYCGSGMTACVVGFVFYTLTNNPQLTVYDGRYKTKQNLF